MTARRNTRRLAEHIVVSLLAIYFVFTAFPPAWKTLNTDFPNYYLVARMAREHTNVERAYEWLWIEREKDHRSIDQRIVGLVPITPFSTLAVWPIALLPALVAKHIWIVLNAGLLVGILFVLPHVSGLTLAQAGILICLSYPLQFNFQLGQYYVLLLGLLTAACWAAQRDKGSISGFLIGLAASLKIFPIIFIFYFLRRREWKAVAVCCITILVAVLLSIWILGFPMHRTYLLEVLPATLRGEGLPPFHLGSSSLSTVLHRLFIYEPQWNRHPAVNASWLFAVLHPVLQLILLGPAVLLIHTQKTSSSRTALEWSGLLMVALTISTSPGSYLFTLLILPVAVAGRHLLRRRHYAGLSILLLCFLVAGYPDWHIAAREGWGTLLCVPRLYALIVICSIVLILLSQKATRKSNPQQLAWALCLISMMLFSVLSGLRHQRNLFEDYKYRLPMRDEILLTAHPFAYGSHDAGYVSLSMNGYRVTNVNAFSSGETAKVANPLLDQLSTASSENHFLTEDVLRTSEVRSNDAAVNPIKDAESPILSQDGLIVGYLREIDGQKQLFVRPQGGPDRSERQVTDFPLNVYEAAFLSNGD